MAEEVQGPTEEMFSSLGGAASTFLNPCFAVLE
jgi:hypothetical protein